jgi:hypothetical protein
MTDSKRPELEFKKRKINELKHPDYNPMKISEKDFRELKNSIKKYGFVDPAIINTHPDRENIIVGGNSRVRAAKELGLTEIPTYQGSWELEAEKELNVRLNRNRGSFDYEKLVSWYDVDHLLNIGFDRSELGPKSTLDARCAVCAMIDDAAVDPVDWHQTSFCDNLVSHCQSIMSDIMKLPSDIPLTMR